MLTLPIRYLGLFLLCSATLLTGCGRKPANREAAEAPPTNPTVVPGGGSDSVHVDNAQRFLLVPSVTRQSVATLNVTGTIQPDPSREIPIVPLANGRVVALHVGLGQIVHKGQLIMEVQSTDVSQAFGSYLKAVADEHLTAVVLARDKLLYDKGAIAQSQLEIAQNGEDDARAALTATEAAAPHPWRRQEPPQRYRARLLPCVRHRHQPEHSRGRCRWRNVCRRGRLLSRCGPFPRMGRLRRIRERPCHRAPRRAGGDPAQRLSRQGPHRDDLGHRRSA